jgi:hypothetical protein
MADPVCRKCKGPVDTWPYDHPHLAICEKCCEDHDYKYERERNWPHCIYCDAAAPPDWYDHYEP